MPLFREVPVDTPKHIDVMYSEITIEVEADEVVMEEDSEIRDTVPDNENKIPKKKKLLKLQILRNCPMMRIAKLFM